jgi:hypothetical protein
MVPRGVVEVRSTHGESGAQNEFRPKNVGSGGIERTTMAGNWMPGPWRDAGQGGDKSPGMAFAVTFTRWIGSAILAFLVISIVAWLVSNVESAKNLALTVAHRTPAPRWAIVSELHAVWVPEAGTVRNSFRIQKFEQCDNIIVEKSMRPILNGNVQIQAPGMILHGNLKELIERLPITGKQGADIFDDAIPEPPPPKPGYYWMTLVLGCSKHGVVSRTEPVSDTVFVYMEHDSKDTIKDDK